MSEPYDNEPLDSQVERLSKVILAEYGEHGAWKGDSRGACDLAIKIMRLETAEIRRLRAENERLKREADVAQDNMNFITRQERDWR